MTDAGYVFFGWGVTAVALGGYVVRLLARARSVSRSLPDDEARPWR